MTRPFKAFLAVLFATVAGSAWSQRAPVAAMVTDVQGAVSIVHDGKAATATLAAELAPPARIELPAGSRLSVLDLASGDELVMTGPATATVRAGGIETAPPERLARKATRIGPVRVREGGLTQAAIVLRASPPIERLPLLTLYNTVTLETRPVFRWAAVEGVGPYRFELADDKGTVLHETRTQATELALPEGMALARERSYTWEVSARRPDGVRFATFGDFSVAAAATRDRAIALRPEAAAPVSAWTSYALWLDGQGLADEARAVWRRVANERPDDPVAKKLAGP
jgi:hypothetical protein